VSGVEGGVRRGNLGFHSDFAAHSALGRG
jgi:hypothetical protein